MHQRSVCGINREDVDTEFRVGMFTRLLCKAAECPWSELFVNLSACYFGFLKLTNATLTRFSEELPPLVWAICKWETSTLCLSPSPLIQFQIAQARQHLGDDWVKRLILCHDKTLVHGDVLVDDKPEVTGSNPVPSWEHVLFGAPYNRHITDRRRIGDWTEWAEVLG